MKPMCELSGGAEGLHGLGLVAPGWRVRLLLATAVARYADVLLLDEPTNHLDAQAPRSELQGLCQAVSWLVGYLTLKRKATSVAGKLRRACKLEPAITLALSKIFKES